VNCQIGGGRFAAEVRSAYARDGEPGINGDFLTDVYVNTPPATGHSYWLVSRLMVRAGVFVYSAKGPVLPTPGQSPVEVLLPTSPVGSKRDLVVVDGDVSVTPWLQENFNHDTDASWDPNRNT